MHTRRYTVGVFIVLIAALIGSVLFGLSSGSVSLSPSEVLSGIFGGGEDRVVWNLRLPRVVLGGLVGMCLAISGLILQAVMMNPLADPGIIGISSGAGLFGIVILLAFPALYSSVPLFAFCGAMLAAIVIYSLAWRGGVQPMRVILAGVAVSALCGAGISAVMVFFSDRVQGALLFMNGSLSLRGWNEVNMLLPYAVIGIVAALLSSRRLNLIVLGDDVARSMGMSVQANRLFLTAVAAMLAAGAVSAVGLLGFVGLIVPHLMRLVLGNNHALLTPATALCGAGLVIFSDTIARTLFSPTEIPVGICMAILGVPFFLYFLRKAM